MPEPTALVDLDVQNSKTSTDIHLTVKSTAGGHVFQLPLPGAIALLNLLVLRLLERRDLESQEALQIFAIRDIMAGVTPDDTKYLRYRLEGGFEFVTARGDASLKALNAELGRVLAGTAVKAHPKPGYFEAPF